ncbi:ionotropic receptor 25a [Sitophilus oryzae]|uniref:Ionotropic receptor 25a n=1 Tax=Sitophilus oryzae TaxID=7048 RepID=A0A6J2XGW4_SITOR|nr:ionotropic receptor 25a [Sitophilus oryzae]
MSKEHTLKFSRIILTEDEDELEQVCTGLSNGINFLLDFTWSGTETALEIANDINIPYIHVDISIAPFLIFLDAYLDSRNSTDVLVVFDRDDYVDQALYFWIDSTRMRMVLSESFTERTAKRIEQIRPIPNSFAIIGTMENVTKLYLQAQQQGIVNLPDRWNLVLTNFQTQPFNKTILAVDPVSLLSMKDDLCCQLMQHDFCQCPDKLAIEDYFIYWTALVFDKILYTASQEEWDFKGTPQCNASRYPDETVERFREVLERIVDDNEKVMRKDGYTVRLNIQGEVEKSYNGQTQVVANYRNGKLTVESDKEIESIKPFYRIGITHALPWSYKEKDPVTGEYYWTGYCADFAQKISEVLGFDFEFVEPQTGTFGEKVNGTWNGVVGDLARGDTDLAITAIIMTADREEVIDFVAPYYEQTGISIVMRKPVRKTSLFKFMTVLKLEVWLSIVAALVVTGFMVWFLDKYSPYSARNNHKAYPYPCRMWKELTLNASTDDTRYRVWDYPIREQYGHILLAINDSNPVENASEGFRLVDEHLDADFAFIHDSSEIKYEISRNCNFTEVGDVFAEKPFAVAVQQGSHLQDDLSKVILDLQKDRFFEQLQAKYWNHSAKGDCPSTDDNEGITLESLGGVFIATLFGLALAMITLAGEVIYYKRKGKKEKEASQTEFTKNFPSKIQPFKFPKGDYPPELDKFNISKTITIGTTFKPVNLKEKMKKDMENVNISHISLYPKARNRITRVD